jgi:hypothetical protein
MKKLATFVHVHDDEGNSHVFGPNDTVPGWAVKKITNPGVWADDPEAEADGDPSEAWTVPQLRTYADGKDIDLGEATKKADILSAIRAAEEGDGNPAA